MNPQYGATPLAAYKMTIVGDPWYPDDWRHRPSFSWDLVNNNPRLTCWPNNPKEAEKVTRRGGKMANTPISAHMGIFDLQKFFKLFDAVIRKETPSLYSMIFNGNVYDSNGNQVKGQLETKSRMDFGRDPDGFIYFQLTDTAEDREPAKYYFRSNRWVEVHANNAELSNVINSSLEAQAYLDALRGIFPLIHVNYYIPDERASKGASTLETLSPSPSTVNVTSNPPKALEKPAVAQGHKPEIESVTPPSQDLPVSTEETDW